MTDISRQQRFAHNVKNNDMRGIGGHAFKQKGYTFPSHKQMDQFEKYNIPFDIDLTLRDLIIILNDNGYRTAGSCSGHTSEGRGFITIIPYYQDAFLYELKQKNPSLYDSGIRYVKSLGGFSKKPIDPDKIKLVIKKYLHVTRVTHIPPKIEGKKGLAIYHAFTFQSVSNRWGD